MKVKNIIKGVWIVFLLALVFHPILTIAFIVSNLGVISGFVAIYIIIRVMIGMTLVDFITKEFDKDKEDK